ELAFFSVEHHIRRNHLSPPDLHKEQLFVEPFCIRAVVGVVDKGQPVSLAFGARADDDAGVPWASFCVIRIGFYEPHGSLRCKLLFGVRRLLIGTLQNGNPNLLCKLWVKGLVADGLTLTLRSVLGKRKLQLKNEEQYELKKKPVVM